MRLLEAHIEVEDVEKSLELYKKLIPHNQFDSWDNGTAAALILDDGAAFGLWKKGKIGILGGQGGRHVHFAFQIKPEEYDHYVVKIKDAGLEPLEYDWGQGYKSVYFFDYDGHQGEFMTKDWLTLRQRVICG